MKGICVTGNSAAAIERLSNALLQLGIPFAAPAKEDPELTFAFWQEQVLAAQGEDQAGAAVEVSRAWEQLAGTLFLSNRKQPFWQWAEQSSVPLLPYWFDFDPSIYFLFAYESPEDYLTRRMEQWDGSQDVHAFMETWMDHTQTLFHFFLRHPRRCTMLRASIASHPDQLIPLLETQWNCNLQVTSFDHAVELLPTSSSNTGDPIRQFFSHVLLNGAPEILDLHREIESSLYDGIEAGTTEGHALTHMLDRAIVYYLDEKYQRAAVIESLEKKLSELAEEEKSRSAALDHLYQSKLELEHQLAEKHARLMQLDQALSQSNQTIRALTAEKDQLAAAHADQGKQVAERDAKIQQLTQAVAEASNARDALAAEKAQLVNAQAEQSRQLSTIKNDHAAAIEAKDKELSTKDSQCKELAEENDLLLSQLHQVQEELEDYFLKYQESRTRLDEVSARLEKMQNAFPEYFSWESIEVTEAPAGKGNQWFWELRNVVSGRRQFSVIRLESKLVKRQLKLALVRESTHSPDLLIRWPTEDAYSLAFQLPGTPKEQRELATSDWQLVDNLLTAIGKWISTPQAKLPDSIDRKLVNSEVLAVQKKFQASRSAFRVDRFTFEQGQTLPQYDSLSVKLEHLMLDGQYLPELRFQLATVQTNESDFGANPRLEFGPECAALIENWFAETYDHRGERLELRFARSEAMDTSVLNALSPNDQILMVNLILLLPEHLRATAAINGLRNTKEKWQDIAENMRDTLLVYLRRSVNTERKIA